MQGLFIGEPCPTLAKAAEILSRLGAKVTEEGLAAADHGFYRDICFKWEGEKHEDEAILVFPRAGEFGAEWGAKFMGFEVEHLLDHDTGPLVTVDLVRLTSLLAAVRTVWPQAQVLVAGQ